jgi:hypothetical protein
VENREDTTEIYDAWVKVRVAMIYAPVHPQENVLD